MNDQPDQQQIHQILIQLHEQLAQAQAEDIDENDQVLLRHLMDDIQVVLYHAETKGETHFNLLERMQVAVTRLEISHPTLTAVIQKAIDTLSIAGI